MQACKGACRVPIGSSSSETYLSFPISAETGIFFQARMCLGFEQLVNVGSALACTHVQDAAFGYAAPACKCAATFLCGGNTI